MPVPLETTRRCAYVRVCVPVSTGPRQPLSCRLARGRARRFERPNGRVRGKDHLMEPDVAVVTVAQAPSLVDVEPGRPDVEVLMTGEAENHVGLFVGQLAVDPATDDAIRPAWCVHLDEVLERVPAAVGKH